MADTTSVRPQEHDHLIVWAAIDSQTREVAGMAAMTYTREEAEAEFGDREVVCMPRDEAKASMLRFMSFLEVRRA